MECSRFAVRVRVLGAAFVGALVGALVFVGLPAAPAGADGLNLFAMSARVAADEGDGLARPVSVNTDLLAAGEPLAVRMNFAPEATFEARVAPAAGVDGGWHHWFGEVTGDPDSSVTLLRRDDAVVALVTTSDGAYRLSYGGAGTQTVEVVDSSALPQGDLVRDVPGPSGPQAAAADPAQVTDGTPVVDVLVAYTPGAETEQGGQAAIESEAALAVAVTNDSYTASDVDAQLRLVQTVRTNVSGQLSGTLLNQLTSTNDGVLDELHAAREAAGADLVALLTESSSSCGIAWLMNQLSTNQAGYGFSATAVNCAVDNMSFAHEIGHNLGATHDRYVASPNPLFADGHGYVDLTARTRTIMAYNNQCVAAGFNCARIARWSNPDQQLNGRPLGIAAGRPDSADDHSALSTSASVVARYRTASAPAPEVQVSVVAPSSALPGAPVTVSMVPDLPEGVTVETQGWSTSQPQCRFANAGALQTTFACPATLLGAQPTITATVTDSTGGVTTGTATITLATPATARTTALRLAVSPPAVSPGGSVSIRGTLTDATTGKPVIGLPVGLFSSRAGAAWVEARQAGTGSDGAVSFVTRQDASTRYALASVSNSVWARARSVTVPVTTAPRVSQRLSAAVVTSGTTVSVTGTVTPAARGETVRLEVLSGRVWRPVTNVFTTPAGGYSFRVRPAKGRWQYRVVKLAGAISGGATGGAMTLTVR